MKSKKMNVEGLGKTQGNKKKQIENGKDPTHTRSNKDDRNWSRSKGIDTSSNIRMSKGELRVYF